MIIRLSWGCNKDEAHIPKQKEISPILGITEGHISEELRWLKSAGVITVRENQYYSIQGPSVWDLNNVRPYNPEKLTKLIGENIKESYQNGKIPSKEPTKTPEYTFDFSSIPPEDLLEIDKDPDRKAAFVAQAYIHYWGKLPSSEADSERLLFYSTEYSSEWIKDAFEAAIDVKKFTYLEGIFKKWRENGRDSSEGSESADDMSGWKVV